MSDNEAILAISDDVTPTPSTAQSAEETISPKKAVPKKTGPKKGVSKKSDVAKHASPKKSAAKKAITTTPSSGPAKKRIERPFPRVELQEAIKVPLAIRHKNAGNSWTPDQVAEAVGYSSKSTSFFYLTAAARDFGLTEGSRDTPQISLTDLGRRLAYAETPEQEFQTRLEAFYNVALFREILNYYKGSSLPEMKYLRNTLESRFSLDPSTHEEFAELFRKNCEYLGIKEGAPDLGPNRINKPEKTKAADESLTSSADFVTVAEPEDDQGLICFVAMPFSEKEGVHPPGFFTEVLKQVIAPAGRRAGFRVVTARKQGSDVIHATIVNGLLDADLVIADLTEHNPNVLFELGMRMADDKPVALIRAGGTKPIFDVDNMLRVEEYNPCLWPSTVEVDLPKITAHIRGAWDDRNSTQTYMKILRNKRAAS